MDSQSVEFETILLNEPQESGTVQKFTLNEHGDRIFVTTSLYPRFHYAQNIHIFGTLKKKVINNEKIILTMYFPKIEAEEHEGNIVLALTSFVRQNIISFFQKNLPPLHSSLLLGIVFGIQGDLSKSFGDDLRNTGVFHVVAASGMNVTLLAGFLSSLMSLLFRRQVAIAIAILAICFYALLSGLSPSIERAAIMGSVVFIAQIFGRQTIALFGLFLAGYGMLAWSPNLLFDIGFQLSFASTLGLLYIRPVLGRLGIVGRLGVLEEDVATTLSAQLATMPIMLSNFGTFSLWSVLVNVLVLWTVPILMITGFLASIGLIIAPVGKLFLYLSLPLLIYFEYVVTTFSHVFGSVKIESFSMVFAIGYYCILIAVIMFLYKRTKLDEFAKDSSY